MTFVESQPLAHVPHRNARAIPCVAFRLITEPSADGRMVEARGILHASRTAHVVA